MSINKKKTTNGVSMVKFIRKISTIQRLELLSITLIVASFLIFCIGIIFSSVIEIIVL